MSYEQQTYTGAPGGAGEDPSKTMAIVGLVLDFVFAPVGLILSIVAKKKSVEAGFDGGLAKIGVIIGIVTTILWVLGVIGYIISFAALMSMSG